MKHLVRCWLIAFAWLKIAFGVRVGWKERLALGLPLPAIAGAAGETTVTLTKLFKDFYPAGGIVNQ